MTYLSVVLIKILNHRLQFIIILASLDTNKNKKKISPVDRMSHI